MSPLAFVYLIIAALGFGGAFALSNIAVHHFSPLHVAAGRAVVAAMATGLFVLFTGVSVPVTPRHILVYLVLGILTVAIPFIAIAWSQSLITSSLGGVIFASMPLVTLLLAPLVLRDSVPRFRQLAGAVAGLGGVAIAATGGSLTPDRSLLLGGGLTIFAVLCYALGGIYVKRFEDIDPRAMSFGQLVFAMLILVAVSIPDLAAMSWPAQHEPYSALVWLGIFSTAIPMMALFLLIREAGPASASLTTFLVPLIAIGIGAVLMSEPIKVTLLAGCVLVLGGAWFVIKVPDSDRKAAP